MLIFHQKSAKENTEIPEFLMYIDSIKIKIKFCI